METKKSQKNNNKMEFGMHIARNSILKEINNGCRKNLVLSPLSLHIALNILASGSTGRTLEQLLGFLESDSISDLNAQSSLLMELATGNEFPSPADDDSNPSKSKQQKRTLSHLSESVYSKSKQQRQNPNRFPQIPTDHVDMPFISGWDVLEYSSSYNQNPSSESGPIICLVNGIWVDKRYPLKHSFKQLAEDVYKANARSVDFENQAEHVTGEINSWAREASKGHINPLFNDPISKDVILVLANALYFKGTWVDPFKASNTKDEDFHLLNGETIRVPFMKRWSTYNFYGSFEGFDLLKMDYKSGRLDNKEYAMYIFLPDKNDGLQELVEKFNSDPRFLVENRKLQEVKLNKLWLPKLKYEYALNVLESMKELGLNLPFDAKKAEIKEMVEITSEEVFYVSEAIQKAYIEVNEEGTIATAVTAFAMQSSGCALPEPSKINFIADHPFLFMIKEEVSDTNLFVGAALNPLA